MTEQERLLETDRNFASMSLEQGAAEAFRHFLTEDAMGMSNGQHPVMGRDKLYASMKADGDDYTLSWEPQHAEVAASSELGWTWGKYVLTFQDEDGREQQRYGKYLNIWKKLESGEWRVAVDMGNSSPAPE